MYYTIYVDLCSAPRICEEKNIIDHLYNMYSVVTIGEKNLHKLLDKTIYLLIIPVSIDEHYI